MAWRKGRAGLGRERTVDQEEGGGRGGEDTGGQGLEQAAGAKIGSSGEQSRTLKGRRRVFGE